MDRHLTTHGAWLYTALARKQVGSGPRMRTEKVLTHFTCDQNCVYCQSRLPTDDRAFVAGSAVRARIDAALGKGAHELVFSGGEPLLRRDLPELFGYARERGARSVVLETNATSVDVARAAKLRRAGLTLARVNLAGASDALDEVTRDPGGFARSWEGLKALLKAEVPVEVCAALVRQTLPLVPELPRLLGTLSPADTVRGLRLTVPIHSPDPSQLLPYAQVVPVVLALEAEARPRGLPLRLAVDGPPPCVFPSRGRIAHLYALTRGAGPREGFEKLSACATCLVADRCQGLASAYLERHGPPAMAPIADDALRRRLSHATSVEAQVERELVTGNRRRVGAEALQERIIRTNFRCNQACRFCFVSTHLPTAPAATVEEAIRAAASEDARIVLSGGEPLLSPHLLDFLRLAKALSLHPVELQTNAVLLDDPARVDALVEAGLDEAFVSLHGACAKTSDSVTEAPGTFDRTVVGLDNLARSSIALRLNFVICRANFEELVPYVRLVAGRWPSASLTISFVAPSTDVVPRERALIPRYSDVAPHLAEALGDARRLGLRVTGFESMCGVPLCLLPEPLNEFFALQKVAPEESAGEFIKAAACHNCALESRCHGLRTGYAELYGTDELRSISPGPHEEAR